VLLLAGLLVGCAPSDSPVIAAVKAGNATELKQLLHGGADSNSLSTAKWPAIVEAAYRGKTELVQMLIDAGADVNAVNGNKFTALTEAAARGNVPLAEHLLSKGADQSITTKEGWTSLSVASLLGKTDVARLLLQHGANPNVQDEQGQSPLYLALQFGHADVAMALLKSGADASLVPNQGLPSSTLHQAADEIEDFTVELCRRLVDAGADIEHAGWNSETPLNQAARRGKNKAVQTLLKCGATPNTVGGYYFKTPVMWASAHGDVDLTRVLLDAGAHRVAIAEGDERQLDALVAAVEAGEPATAKLLLSEGADPDTVIKETGMPLINAAVLYENKDLIEVLLGAGADVKAKDKDGRTAIDIAQNSSDESIRTMLANTKRKK